MQGYFYVMYGPCSTHANHTVINDKIVYEQPDQIKKMSHASKHTHFIPTAANDAQPSLDKKGAATASVSVTSTKQIIYTRTNIAVGKKPLQHPGNMKLPLIKTLR
ncbi:MAG: hypothetical protein ABJB86_19240 [Bacteroidota bacterium]